jgi:hypothetical protein
MGSKLERFQFQRSFGQKCPHRVGVKVKLYAFCKTELQIISRSYIYIVVVIGYMFRLCEKNNRQLKHVLKNFLYPKIRQLCGNQRQAGLFGRKKKSILMSLIQGPYLSHFER